MPLAVLIIVPGVPVHCRPPVWPLPAGYAWVGTSSAACGAVKAR